MKIFIFIKLKNRIKKVQCKPDTNLNDIKMFFLEHFDCSSVFLDYPLYIEDPIYHLSYELDNLEEIENGSIIELKVDGI